MKAHTSCIACGQQLPNGSHFCDGYRGADGGRLGYDTHQCQCDCHWSAA